MAGSLKVNKVATIVLIVLAAVPSVLGGLKDILNIDPALLGAVSTIATLIAGLLKSPVKKAPPELPLPDAETP